MSTPYTVDRTRWPKLDIFNQMGNIYSEVGRSIKANKENKPLKDNEALIRAIDLFDATIDALIAQHSPRAKEVLRAKEQFLSVMTDSNTNQDAINSLERY